MFFKFSAHAGWLLFSLICPQTSLVGGEQPHTSRSYVESLLNEHGVAPDPEAIRSALRANDSLVRVLAAQEIAERRYPDAAGLLLQAVQSETQQGARVQIAGALSQIDATLGHNILQTSCRDKALNPGVRLEAIRLLQKNNNHSCDQEVIPISRISNDRATRIFALMLSASEDCLSPNEPSFEAQRLALSDEDPLIRVAAIEALGRSCRAKALPVVKQQQAIEKDPRVLAAISNQITRLDKVQSALP